MIVASNKEHVMVELEYLRIDLSRLLLWGKIPCSPSEEDWNQMDPIPLREYLSSKPKQLDCFEVKGRSMIGAGLEPGDIILVEMGTEPRPGQVVVCLVDGYKFTAKRWTGEDVVTDTRQRLEHEIFCTERIEVLGVVLRNMKPLIDHD